MKKDDTVIVVMFVCIFLFLGTLSICTIALIHALLNEPQHNIRYEITDKYEFQDNHYIDIQVEVSPEEYIGYDVGDEYELRKED